MIPPIDYNELTKRQLAEMAVEGDEKAMVYLELRNQTEAREAQLAKRAKAKDSEAEIQKRIVKTLEAAGWLVIRVNSAVQSPDDRRFLRCYYVQNIGASSGHADIVAYRDGRAVFLEVKAAKGRQSDSQKKFQDACQRYGMPYFIVHSPEEALQCLKTP